MNSKNRLYFVGTLVALPLSVSNFGCGGAQTAVTRTAPPLTITTTSLPNGTVNDPYSVALQSSGGTAPVTWTLGTGTALPLGLSLSSSGAISGTPNTPGSSCVEVTAIGSVNTAGDMASQFLCIGINSADASHNSLLKGHYAFLISGFGNRGIFPSGAATVGSFVADGGGNVTSGVSDTHATGGVGANQPFTGTYALGSDNRGTMSLGISGGGTVTLAFSLGSVSTSGLATKGRIIQLIQYGDPTFGEFGAPPGAGEFELQDTTAFSDSAITGPYAFGLSGWGAFEGQFGADGVFTADGAGNIPSGTLDENLKGAVTPNQPLTGTYNVASGSTAGRGTASLTIAGRALHMAFYVVSASKLLIVSAEQAANPLVFTGQALKQSGGPFSNSSLHGTDVLNTIATADDVTAGLATFDGAGTITLLQDQNNAGAVTSGSTIIETYSVASNGRVTVTAAGSTVSALYLVSPDVAFILNTDSHAGTRFLEPQSAGPFSNSSINGSFFFGDPSPSFPGTPAISGVATLNEGAMNLTSDIDQFGMPLVYGQTSTDTYSISPNGRGTTGSANEVIYIVSPKKFVVIDVSPGDTRPTIKVFEQ